jgi:hypothetical protein
VTVFELVEILQTADQQATVVFLPWGADEDEVEEVKAVAVPERQWTRETFTAKGREYMTLYPGGPRTDLGPECENVVDESVSVVVLSVDNEFLSSRRLF